MECRSACPTTNYYTDGFQCKGKNKLSRSKFIHVACDPSCLECSGPNANQCTKCDSSTALKYLKTDGTCASACNNNQLIDNFVCKDCSNKCDGCTA